MKDRYLIIDGYNMIGQSRELSKVARESLEEAREQLLDVRLYVYLMHMNNLV